jgi:hypothetical protein
MKNAFFFKILNTFWERNILKGKLTSQFDKKRINSPGYEPEITRGRDVFYRIWKENKFI